MTEFEMMVIMLNRVKPSCHWVVDKKNRTIELCCSDDWYTRTFHFNKDGKLVSLD